MLNWALSTTTYTTRPYDSVQVTVDQYTKCLSSEGLTTNLISYTGPAFDTSSILIGSSSTTITIPNCKLFAFNSYTFNYETYYTNYPATKFPISFTVNVNPEDFVIALSYVNSANFDAIVTVSLTATTPCSYTNTTNYFMTWTCQNSTSLTGTYSTCTDSSTPIFGVQLSSQFTFTVPSNLRLGSIVQKLTLTTVRGDLTKTNQINLINSYIQIIELETPSRCFVKLSSDIASIEKALYTITYNWELVSSTGTDASILGLLLQYLSF